MLRDESGEISGITSKLKSYFMDLNSAFLVFDAQESHRNARTTEEKRKREIDLILLRAKVNNQVLIKNYNMGDFI